MLILKNGTGSASKVGYLATESSRQGYFTYAKPGDDIIGVVSQKVSNNSMCEITTTGKAKVYVTKKVLTGSFLRQPRAGEGLPAGAATRFSDGDLETIIGKVVQDGVGLVDVAINIQPGLESGAGASGTYTFANGVQENSGLVELDINGLAAIPSLSSNDKFVFYYNTSSAHVAITYSNLISNLESDLSIDLANLGDYSASGDLIIGGASAWGTISRGLDNQVLKVSSSTLSWGFVDWSELIGTQPAPVSHTHTLSDITDIADLADTYPTRAEWDQNGFVDADDVSLSWSDAARELFLAPATGSLEYYIAGVKYTLTTTISKSIANEDGLWVFYMASEGVISAVKNPTHSQIDNVIENTCIIAYVYWNSTLVDGRLMYELHGSRMSPATHHYLHDNIGAVYSSGMAPGDILADEDGSLDTHAQFSMSIGSFYDEDINILLPEMDASDQYEVWYRSGTVWTWTTSSFPVITTGTGRVAYDNSGTLTEAPNTDYVLCHVFATNIVSDLGVNPKYIFVVGQNVYNNANDAESGAETELSSLTTDGLPLQEMVPVATFIFYTADALTNTPNAKIVSTATGDDYVDWRETSGIGGGGGVSTGSHGDLTDLGVDDHPQYALLNGRSGDVLKIDTINDYGGSGVTIESINFNAGIINYPSGAYISPPNSVGGVLFIGAYDTDIGGSPVVFATLTSNSTPTVNLTTSVTIGGNTIAYNGGAFHDSFSDYVANEHIDWTGATQNLETSGSIKGITTYTNVINEYTVDNGVSVEAVTFLDGVITGGLWQGSAIADAYISSASTWNSKQPGDAGLSAIAALTHPGGGSYIIQMTATDTYSVTDTAPKATVLANARTINGTSFNGSANITTSSWGTSRTITIGDTGKAVNGSANVAWTVLEISDNLGSLHDLTYANAAFVKMTGPNTFSLDESSFSLSGHSHSNLVAGTGLAGTTYDGTSAVTWSLDLTEPTQQLSLDDADIFIFHDSSAAGTRQIPYSNLQSSILTGTASSANTLATSRTITIGDTGRSFNGSANITWTAAQISPNLGSLSDLTYTASAFVKMSGPNTFALDLSTYSLSTHNHDGDYSPIGHSHSNLTAGLGISGTTYDGTGAVTFALDFTEPTQLLLPDDADIFVFHDSSAGILKQIPFSNLQTEILSGNATTATTLQTARTITIGDTGRSFNGSSDISWTAAQIDANLGSLSDLTYANAAFVKMTGPNTFALDESTYNTVIGTDTDINTSGATIIDNIFVTDGVITAMGTRDLTASDIGAAADSHGHTTLSGMTTITMSGNPSVIQQTSSSVYELQLKSLGSVAVWIDSNNNDTDKVFKVISNGATTVFNIDESGNLTLPSGGNIVISGTLSAGGYNDTNWNTAYSERQQWSGTSTNLNASTARTSLGLTGTVTTHNHSGTYQPLDAALTSLAGLTYPGSGSYLIQMTATDTLSVTSNNSSNWDSAYTHSQDNSQAHSDYLINNGNDTTSGILTAKAFRSSSTTTDYNLLARNSTAAALYVQIGGATGTIASFRYNSMTAGSGTQVMGITNSAVSITGSLTVSGNITGYSDIRGKENIVPINNTWVLRKMSLLRPIEYNYKDLNANNSEGRQYGLSAQNLHEVFPNAVNYSKEDDVYSIRMLPLTSLNTSAIIALENKVSVLEATVLSLQSEINTLRRR